MPTQLVAGGLILLLGLPYLAVFVYDWFGDSAHPAAGVISGLLVAFGGYLFHAGIRSVRKSRQGLAEWSRVQGAIVDVRRMIKSNTWVMWVRWKDPASGSVHERRSEPFEVHPRYALPDMTVPVALEPGRPDRGLIDISALRGVPEPELPSFSFGEWVRAYLASIRGLFNRPIKAVVLALVLIFPVGFIYAGVSDLLWELTNAEPSLGTPILGLAAGLAMLGCLLWFVAPRKALMSEYLKKNGVRTEAKIVGLDPARHDTWAVVLQWPSGGHRVEILEQQPQQASLVVWRSPGNPRMWSVEKP